MKRFAFVSAVVLAGLFFITSCDSSSEETLSDVAIDEMDLETEATASASLEEVDLIAEAGMESLSGPGSGRLERDVIIECAVVERDTAVQKIVIDFGDGCEGPNGVIRKGKIIIAYSGRRYVPGAYRIVTFENFFLDSVQVEGVRKLENISDSTSTLKFEATLTEGRLIFPDSSTYTREANHVRSLFRTENRLDDYATLTGEANGTNREEAAYAVKILEELVFKRACSKGRVFIPVSGIVEKTIGDKQITVDYGDGECDNLAVVTVDGISREIEIRPRGIRRK